MLEAAEFTKVSVTERPIASGRLLNSSPWSLRALRTSSAEIPGMSTEAPLDSGLPKRSRAHSSRRRKPPRAGRVIGPNRSDNETTSAPRAGNAISSRSPSKPKIPGKRELRRRDISSGSHRLPTNCATAERWPDRLRPIVRSSIRYCTTVQRSLSFDRPKVERMPGDGSSSPCFAKQALLMGISG